MITTKKWIAAGQVAAVVSGAFCLSSNRSKSLGSGTFGGVGWVIGPDGEILGLTTPKRHFVTADINLAEADRAKKTYPRYCLASD